MYPEALQRAQLFNMPQFFWDPLLRAAALGKMGLMEEARLAIAELFRLKPNFPTHAWRLCGFFLKTDALVDEILDGLNKAGLAI